jgi:TrpR-related protein YerC/YecD
VLKYSYYILLQSLFAVIILDLEVDNVNSKLKNESTDFLFKAILSLKNEEECYRFFEDLCTSAELKAMSQRFLVAKMLSQKMVYTDIVNETGASTATISRVKRALFDNDTYGYKTALDNIAEGEAE